MTEKVYLTDSYMKECSATVQRVSGTFVVLDRSIFYPQGGGQPADTGKITKNGRAFSVVFAKKTGEDISLEVDTEGLQKGDQVLCSLDWKKRHVFMRMHTAAHIVSKVVHDETGALITGNQLGLEESRMDFNVAEFNRELLQGVEDKANEIIQKELEVNVSFLPVEEALKNPELVRLKDIMPKGLHEWRVVSIGTVDIQADGGTHVANTKEIGLVKITRLKNKGAHNRRLYFSLK